METKNKSRKPAIKPPAAAAIPVAVEELLQQLPGRFDDSAMQRRDMLLGVAGREMNLAYETSSAIGGIAEMLQANSVNEDLGEPVLSGIQVSYLMAAIKILAFNLNSSLCMVADSFDQQIGKQKGGA